MELMYFVRTRVVMGYRLDVVLKEVATREKTRLRCPLFFWDLLKDLQHLILPEFSRSLQQEECRHFGFEARSLRRHCCSALPPPPRPLFRLGGGEEEVHSNNSGLEKSKAAEGML